MMKIQFLKDKYGKEQLLDCFNIADIPGRTFSLKELHASNFYEIYFFFEGGGAVFFIFEESFNNEDAASLVIKIPAAKAYIAQDIVYNKTHLFISGNTDGWRKALKKIQAEKEYTLILPGHGEPADRSVLKANLKLPFPRFTNRQF